MEQERVNPYQKTVEIMREVGAQSNPQVYHIAQVLSPRPLKLRLGEITLSSDQVMIDERLLKNSERKYSVASAALTGVTDAVNTPEGTGNIAGSVTASGGNLSLKTKEDYLKAGDKVLLIPSTDGQLFYLIAKVVQAPE
jgi:hypothetical protein